MIMSENQVAVAEQPRASQIRVVENQIDVLDTAKFDHMWRIAKVMATGSLIPETLRTTGNKQNKVDLPPDVVAANCFLVVNQAVRWGMDPFAVVGCCSVVHGRLMYEGKLVAAVLQAKSGVRLRYEYNDASGMAFGVRVVGRLQGEAEEREVFGTVGDWRTTGDRSPWDSPGNHRRQLAYRGAREWGRIHDPSALLGVYTDDEFDEVAAISKPALETVSKPLLLDASFPETDKAPAKAKKETALKPAAQKADAKPVDTTKTETKTEAKAEAEAAPAAPVLDFTEYELLMVEGVSNPLQLINEVTFANGKIAIDQATLANVWVLAAPYLGADIEGSLPQAIAAIALCSDLDKVEDLISHIENASHFKGMDLGSRNTAKATFAALRARLVGMEGSTDA
jgi:hypothetical protein